MGRAEDARASGGSGALFPRVAFLPRTPLQFTLCRAPRELRAEAQSRSPEDRSLRAAIFGPGCGRRWRGGARGSVCERWLSGAAAASPAKERREGEPGAGWRLDRASVTSSRPQSGAAPCRLLACQGARLGGAQGSERGRLSQQGSGGWSLGRVCWGYLRALPQPGSSTLVWRGRYCLPSPSARLGTD